MNDTIKYYNTNAEAYFNSSINADMSSLYAEFLGYIPSKGSILDLGCGSGRDLKYFHEHGYIAEGIDASKELCKLAEEYSGCHVYCDTIQNFISHEKYDGVWACASLLHLRECEIRDFFKGIDRLVVPGGIVFASMKSGITTGQDDKNRYFTNFNEQFLDTIVQENNNLVIVKSWYSQDTLNRKEFSWLNFIIKRILL